MHVNCLTEYRTFLDVLQLRISIESEPENTRGTGGASSRKPRHPGRHQSERPADFDRNKWPTSIGMPGRHHRNAQLGDIDNALAHYRDMLKLNPNDNQGIRYVLAGCLLRQDNDSALKELLAAYEDESASWLYTRALVAFRESGDSDKQAAALVRGAWSANQHVPAILAGTKPPVISDDGYVTMGGPDEATYYVTECGAAWHRTPGAVAWLTKLATTLAPKRRTRATMH